MSNSSQELKCEIIRVDDPNIHETQWKTLEEECSPHYFLTWEWIGAWANMIKSKTDLYLFSAEKNDNIIALCFLTTHETTRLKGLINSKQVSLNEYLANEFNMISKYNGLLVNIDYFDSAWHSLCKCLLSWENEWDELATNAASMSNIETISRNCSSLKLYVDKIHSIWSVPIDKSCATIDNLLNTFKPKSRKRLQQTINSIEEKYGEISISSAETTEEALKYFNCMEVLHTERWQRAGRGGSFTRRNWVNFHSNLIMNAYPKGNALIVSINAGTLNIGYIYAHLLHDTVYIQQTGFLRTKDRSFMTGYVSHCYTMAYCASIGFRKYDFLPDDRNSYKSFFTERGNPIYYARFQKPKIKFLVEKFIRLILSK